MKITSLDLELVSLIFALISFISAIAYNSELLMLLGWGFVILQIISYFKTETEFPYD